MAPLKAPPDHQRTDPRRPRTLYKGTGTGVSFVKGLPMNLLPAFAGAALVLAASAPAEVPAPPASSSVCINARNIQRTEVQDDRTILFHMRDGKVWQNRLRQICPMLKTSPWTQVLHNDQVCSNQQFIRVIRTGDTCSLGDFTPVSL